MDEYSRIKYLVEQLNLASDAYYGGQGEIMSNYEWDSMFDELEALESKTGFVLPNSPTHFISRSKQDDITDNKEKHEFPALSLAKTKKIEDLVQWADNRDVWVSWKLDGLTLVLTYDNGQLVKILTRGNGLAGTNITYFKNSIKGFPLTIQDKSHLVVRGEATISYKDFESINVLGNSGEKYANPRNLAAGTLALDPSKKDIVLNRNVTFVAFTLVHIDRDIISWGERMSYLDSLGFTTVEREKTNANSLPLVVGKWSQKVDNDLVDIPVDGLVICYDDTHYASTGSVTGHHATRAGLAFKWQDQVAITTLKFIEWSCAASVITPVAVFNPVNIEGTTVSRASLCNISELERLDIGDDGRTEIKIIKANKIIPKCVGVVKKSGHFKIPDVCPVCHAKTAIIENTVSRTKVLKCTNPECPAKSLNRFVRFVSRQGINIDGLSFKTIALFINKGLLRQFQDIFNLPYYYDLICSFEGFGKKSCDKLMDAIEKSKQVNDQNLIYSLCIPLIGVDAAKRIISQIGYDNFINRAISGQGFEDVIGIGSEKSGKILEWFSNNDNLHTFYALQDVLTIVRTNKDDKAEKTCKDLVFAITGNLTRFLNRDELVRYIENRGGRVTSTVSGKTNYLINNDTSSKSSKNLKAMQLGIDIIDEDTFVSKFGDAQEEKNNMTQEINMDAEKIRELIKRRRFQILVHSYIYYKLNDNVISNEEFDKWARELITLQSQFPVISQNTELYDIFKDFTNVGDAAFLPFDNPELEKRAKHILMNHSGQPFEE